MKVIAVVQARSSSSRLPGKVLKEILGRPMILRQLDRVRRARRIDELVIATSTDASDDGLVALLKREGYAVRRGSLDDVLARFTKAVEGSDATHVVRLTGDCPLADPALIDQVIRLAERTGADYASNTQRLTYPDGLDVEVMKVAVLQRAGAEAQARSEREHVTPYIYKHPELFRLENLAHDEDLSAERWTVDELADFEFVTRVYQALLPSNPAFGWRDVLHLVRTQPGLRLTNNMFERNEGYLRSLAEDRND